jgi:hypothetical protein
MTYRNYGKCRGCDQTIEGATYYKCGVCGAFGCFKSGFLSSVGCYPAFNCPQCGRHKTMEKIGYVERLRG